jgi:PAS domain S-box-containing protein
MTHEGQVSGGVQAADAMLRVSEERFRPFFELIPVAVYSCDRAGVIQEFNRRAVELWGREPTPGDTEEQFWSLIRRPDGTCLPHGGHPGAEVLSGAIPFVDNEEFQIQRPDGSRVTVIAAIHPLKNELAEIIGAINCFYDITERKRTPEALLEQGACYAGQKEALQAALSGAPLNVSLNVLVRTAIERFGDGTRAAFYLTNPDRTSLHHVVGMPEDYSANIDGLSNGPESIATYTRKAVVTSDVRNEPSWGPWLWLVERFDFRSCWNFPIYGPSERLVAAFVVYLRQPREATECDLEFASSLTETASSIISRHTEVGERRRSDTFSPEGEAASRRQKDQFTTLVEHMPDIVARFDRNLRYLYISPPVEAITGVRHEDYIGKPRTNKGVSAEYAALREELSRKVFETGEKQILEFPIDTASGTRRLEMRLLPEFAPDGSVESLMTLTRDVTERAQAEAALRASEERFRTLFELGPVAVYSCDKAGVIQEFNRRAVELWGREPARGDTEEQFCRSLRMLRPDGTDLSHDKSPMAEVLSGAVPFIDNAEFELERADGSLATVIAAIRPLKNEQGEITGAISCFYDITDRKRAEEVQRLLLGELNHRVKNTLATIQAIAQQTLRRTSSSEQFVASFSGRIQALARAHTLLTNTTWRGADLRDLIRDQVLLGPIDESRLTAWGPSIMLGSEMALHVALVLHELATNSCKYGALSGAEGQVTVSWTVRGGELQLRWLERGGPPVNVTARRGFGSMMIEQSARAHQGSAEILCEREGVSWTITLPLQAAVTDASTPLPPVPNMPAGHPARAKTPSTPSISPLTGKRVLVVEDEPLVAFDAVATIEHAGGVVVGPAGTLEEALRLIEMEFLDGALVDGNLRGRPVDEIAAALTRRNVPFAFMTGYDRRSLPHGFNNAAMLMKPYSHERLIETIVKLVAHRPTSTQPSYLRGPREPT